MGTLSRIQNGRPPIAESLWHEARRFAQFATVGAVSTAVDFGLLALLRAAGLALLGANLISYSAGIAVNFAINRRWTYAESRARTLSGQFARFLAVSLTGLILNSAIVAALASPIGLVAAKLTATAITLCWNFLANRLWTFNDVRIGAPAAPRKA